MCYDWAAAFLRTIGTQGMLSGSVLRLDDPRDHSIIPQHYAIPITAGTGGPGCKVFIDDGFLGDGTVHGGDWDTGNYKDAKTNRFDQRLPHGPGSQGPF